MLGAVFALQGRFELAEELVAIGQACQPVALCPLAQLLDLRRLQLEGLLQAHHHRIHRLRQRLQFLHRRLGHGDETAFDQRPGLPHRRIERPPDARHGQHHEQPRGQSHNAEGGGGAQACAPQFVVGERQAARHLYAAQRAPAVRDLGKARHRLDRDGAHEPLRRDGRALRGRANERRTAVRRVEADLAVGTGIELGRQQQIHQRPLAVLLGQCQGQHRSTVTVLESKLGLQVASRRQHVHAHAA